MHDLVGAVGGGLQARTGLRFEIGQAFAQIRDLAAQPVARLRDLLVTGFGRGLEQRLGFVGQGGRGGVGVSMNSAP
jgi:hypothetical protein